MNGLENEQNGNLGTDYFVQCWIPYEWNESMEWIQEAGQTTKTRWPVGDKPPKATWPAQRNRTTDDV